MDYFQEITHQAIILYEAKLVASLNPDTIPLNQAICTASPYFTNESKWLQLYEGLNSELKVKYSAHIYPEAKLGYATYLFHGLTETLLPTFRSFTAHRAKYVNVSLKGLSREQIEELGILVNVCDALYYWSAITIDTIKIFSPVEFKKYYDQIGEYIDLEELRPNPRPQPGRLVAPATTPPPAVNEQVNHIGVYAVAAMCHYLEEAGFITKFRSRAKFIQDELIPKYGFTLDSISNKCSQMENIDFRERQKGAIRKAIVLMETTEAFNFNKAILLAKADCE